MRPHPGRIAAIGLRWSIVWWSLHLGLWAAYYGFDVLAPMAAGRDAAVEGLVLVARNALVACLACAIVAAALKRTSGQPPNAIVARLEQRLGRGFSCVLLVWFAFADFSVMVADLRIIQLLRT